MAVDDQPQSHTRTLRVPRSRGAVSGLVLMLLGLWGAVIPFAGPYFGYSYQSGATWVWSAARFWLEVLPGAVTVVGGALLLRSANRIIGSAGGWLGVAGGAWFVVGQSLAGLLRLGSVGQPVSNSSSGQAAAQLGYFYGLGALILLFSAFALGRLAVVGVRDVRAAQRRERASLLARRAKAAGGPAAKEASAASTIARSGTVTSAAPRPVTDTASKGAPVEGGAPGSHRRATPSERP